MPPEMRRTLYCRQIREYQQARRVKPLDGWYKSAATTWLGYERSCIADPGSQFLFHAVTVGNEYGAIPSIWNGIVRDHREYREMMSGSPWGKRVYNYVRSQGWLDTPEFHTLTGADMIALGVPKCS